MRKNRVRWLLYSLQDWASSQDARIIGGLVAAALLIAGGFFAAQRVAGSSASTGGEVRITTKLPVTETIHGHRVVRYKRKVVYAHPSTSLQTQTIGGKVVTRPVVHYHVIYRKRVVTRNGKAVTVLQPVTSTSQLTQTDLVTTTVVSDRTTTRTVEQPVTTTVTVRTTTTVVNGTTVTVTVPVTTTIVSTQTDTQTVTVTTPAGP